MKRLLSWFAICVLSFLLGFTSAVLTRRFQSQPNLKSVDVASAPEAKTDAPDDIVVEGRYSNFDYGYSVLVPKGMRGARNPAPAPNHGFGIDLGNPNSTSWMNKDGWPKAYLSVDASYNAPLYDSVNDIVKNSLKWRSEKQGRVILVSRSVTLLAGLKAVRFRIAYDKDGERMIEDQIVAIRNDPHDEIGIIYTIHLTTTLSRYYQDKQPILEIQRSWILDPLPGDHSLPAVYEEEN